MSIATRDRRYAAGATLAVCLGLVCGFLMLGTPSAQRELAADQRRIEDLRSIASEMQQRFSASPLPATLTETGIRLQDPVTSQPYRYQRLSDSRYQLCATFSTPGRQEDRPGFWRHGAGDGCFTLDATRPVPY